MVFNPKEKLRNL